MLGAQNNNILPPPQNTKKNTKTLKLSYIIGKTKVNKNSQKF